MPVVAVTRKVGGMPPPAIQNALETGQGACTDCVKMLSYTIDALEKNTLTQGQAVLLDRYFCSGPDPEQIIKILTRTRDGLRDAEITITYGWFNNAKPSESTKMELAYAQFKSPVQILRYMIHEATHMFAGTVDFGDAGYIDNDGTFRSEGLAAEDANKNADSYAVFVMLFHERTLV